MKLVRTLFALALALSCATLALAQQNAAPKQTSGAPKLVLQSFTHDFGEVKAGQPLTYSFKIKNEGTADLLIKSVSPG